MPSPLSIVSIAASVVASSIKALQIYSDVSTHFKAISVSELSAKTDFDCVATTLHKFQQIMLWRPCRAAQWESSEELPGKTLRSTMEACVSIFTVITQELQGLTNESLDSCRPWTTKAHFVLLWDASDVRLALLRISALIPALDFLHSALISECKAEMMDILTGQQSRKTFARLAFSVDRLRARPNGHFIPTESHSPNQAAFAAANLEVDLDSYFINSESYQRAWVSAKFKSSSTQVTHPNHRRREPRYLARAIASFQAASQHPNQLSFHRSEVLEVSKMQGLWWHGRKETGETGRVSSNYLTLLDTFPSTQTNDSLQLLKRLPQANSPPLLHTLIPKKPQRETSKVVADLKIPDMFSSLDHPQIAQAVLNAPE